MELGTSKNDEEKVRRDKRAQLKALNLRGVGTPQTEYFQER
jgi:hypothetical protein